MMKRSIQCAVVPVLLAIALTTVCLAQPQQPDPDFATLMTRVRERVLKYYVDLQRLAWTESARRETLKEDQTPKDQPRELVYDTVLKLQLLAPDDKSLPFYLRPQSDLRQVDGKAVKKGTTPKANDPRSEGSGWLSFILATEWRTPHYTFSYVGRGDLKGHSTFLIDVTFASPTWMWVPPVSPGSFKPGPGEVPQALWKGDAFAIYGLRQTGRIWVDADTFDVLQIEIRTKPFEFSKPNGREKFTFEYVMTSSFRAMTFESPKETLMVPESINQVFSTRGWRIPVLRNVHSFTDFKRFSGDIEIRTLRLEDLPK